MNVYALRQKLAKADRALPVLCLAQQPTRAFLACSLETGESAVVLVADPTKDISGLDLRVPRNPLEATKVSAERRRGKTPDVLGRRLGPR